MTYPLLLQPAYKDYLWGGDRIPHHFHRNLPPGIYAESWEVSDRPDGMATIANGSLAGAPLAQAIATWGSDLLGSRVPSTRFPLLIKLIDAHQKLSVQVHPDDHAAARFGGEAKTECWYILHADPGAGIYAGFKPGVDPAAYTEAVAQGATGQLLNRLHVHTGDTIFIPGGLVHAIDAGCLILEVQQNSNTTYRIDDWGRVGSDGTPRELHLQQAADAIRWDLTGDPRVTPRNLTTPGGNPARHLVHSPYFHLDQIDLHHPEPIDGFGQTFIVLFVASGSARLDGPHGPLDLAPGSTCLLPARLPGTTLTPTPHSDI
ncbi:MAG TPA: class I mannose-6-phosphate isomerase, partial [Kiritimatiellia bacterium]|nr:class I mannose-6-phosphate isomerase [Kiritimatiellia bacterium]